MSVPLRVHPLVWYAAAYGGSAAILKAFGFGMFLWLASALTVDDYASFGLLYALQTGVGTLAIAGIAESVVGLLNDYQSKAMRARLFGAANVVFVMMGVISVGLALLLFWALARPSMVPRLGLASVLLVGTLTAFLYLQASLVRLEERHAAALSLSFLGPLCGLLGGLLGFWVGQSVTAFFLGSALGLSFCALTFGLCGIGTYSVVSAIRDVAPILLRIAPFVGIAFLGWLSGYGNNYFVEVFFERVEVATFTFALTLSGVAQLVAASLLQVWSPRFYRIVYEDSFAEVERKNRRFFRWQAVAIGLSGGVVVAVLPIGIDFIGGHVIAYREIRMELFLLFAGYVVLSPWWHCQNYFLVHGKGQALMKVVLRTSALGVVLWLLLMWLLGPIGIYLGFLVQMTARMLGLVLAAKRLWPITIAWEGVAAGLVLLSGGLAVSMGLFMFPVPH